jgi:superfamily II DNA or RNA helicase
MNKDKKRLEKERRREHARRVERQRRIEADRCAELMFDAGLLWDEGDFEGSLRALEKVLKIRPNHAEALERCAEACFTLGRYREGLSRYEHLREAPRWPPVIYGAAVAAWNLGRIAQCKELVTEFLHVTRGSKEFAPSRKNARVLANDVERVIRAPRPAEESLQPELILLPSNSFETSPKTPKPSTGRKAMEPAVQPEIELPPFPKISIPDIPVQFEFDSKIPEGPRPLDVSPVAEVFLRRDYALLRLQKGFDEMLSPGAARNVEHFWYQIETVRRVLRDFRGRALLADEVGLGKTIEACMALKEYWMRGLVRKALILTPPSLVSQWLEELASKFNMTAVSPETGGYPADPERFWLRHDLVVASLALARQPANRERLVKIEYDLVVIDEAHYVKNRSTAAWQLVNELKKRFLLLLSATPVGNDLTELYNLILLLRPGLLGTEAQFRRNYGTGPGAGKHALQDPDRREKLRGLLREVMVRNTRSHIDLKLPRRLAATERVKPQAMEAEALEALDAFIRARYTSASPSERFRLMMLRMQAGSSPSALRFGLRDSASWGNGIDAIVAIGEKLSQIHRSAKADALIKMASRSREKKIVFTRFLATLEELRQALLSEGFSVAVFQGDLSSAEKEAAIADFRDRSEILLSSESGGEGRNLQFCNTVINYDLPWNPMAIEQRVGRVHRIGQAREVYVFNFCLAGSVEEYVLQVLHEKINLFELVAGEMEMILGELGQEQDFSSIVMDLWARSAAPAECESAFDRFAEELRAAKVQYQKTREADKALFGEDYEV